MKRVCAAHYQVCPLLTWSLKAIYKYSINLFDSQARSLTAKSLFSLEPIRGKQLSEQGENFVKEILTCVCADTKHLTCDFVSEVVRFSAINPEQGAWRSIHRRLD